MHTNKGRDDPDRQRMPGANLRSVRFVLLLKAGYNLDVGRKLTWAVMSLRVLIIKLLWENRTTQEMGKILCV